MKIQFELTIINKTVMKRMRIGKRVAAHLLQRPGLPFLIMISLLMAGCGKESRVEVYQHFPDKTWDRFNKLKFELAVKEGKQNHDLILYAYLSKRYEYNTLEFNAIINSPSGEERINEYQLLVRSDSTGIINGCSTDSCPVNLALKRSLFISKPGTLVVELENLIPRLKTSGIYGIGIRLLPAEE
jgi:gliding motility-associated lipoprotein GldH